jgi:hypothetical protein
MSSSPFFPPRAAWRYVPASMKWHYTPDGWMREARKLQRHF